MVSATLSLGRSMLLLTGKFCMLSLDDGAGGHLRTMGHPLQGLPQSAVPGHKAAYQLLRLWREYCMGYHRYVTNDDMDGWPLTTSL